MDGVHGCDEDQIAPVVLDLLNFTEWIPIILGTPTISHMTNVMKEREREREREMDTLAMPWENARVAHLLSVHRAAANMVGDEPTGGANLNGYEEVVITKNTETIDAFSSHVIPIRVEKAYTRECINVMTQALWTKDSSLLQGLTIQNAYTELRKGSKNAVVVVRNSMAYLQTLQKKVPVARAVAAITVPEPPPETRAWGEDVPQNPHTPKLTVRQR